MKKIIFSLSALAALLLAGSCQRENLEPVQQGGTVTYTVQVPGDLATKASSERFELIYEVYRDDNTLISESAEPILFDQNGKVELSLEFVKDQNFTVLFWAQKEGSEVYNVVNLQAVTLNTGLKSNDGMAEVFAGTDSVNNCESAHGGNIDLVRPVAQLNIATLTSGLTLGEGTNAANVDPGKIKVEVAGLYNTYNVATSNASGTLSTVDEPVYYAEADAPKTPFNTDYTLVGSTYVGFIPSIGATVNVDFTINAGQDGNINHKVSNVPVKPNYKTNIIGNLISATADYNVTLEDDWNTPSEVYSIWDGETMTEPSLDQTAATYVIDEASDLAWFAAAVNGTLPQTRTGSAIDNFQGKTFVLTSDVDLAGHEWTPIGMSTTLAETFRGTFDGNGHAIYGLTVNQNEVAGLFGYVYAATIKNVTIEGASINSNHLAGGIVGWVNNSTGNIQVPFVLENCHVKNSTITSAAEIVNGEWDNGDKVGGLVGYAYFGGKDHKANVGAKISNCSVKNATIKAYRDFGGLVGYASHVAIENTAAENVTLVQDLAHDYKAPNTPTTFGEFIGRNDGDNTTIDGKKYVADGVTKDSEGNYHIYNAAALKWVSKQVNTMEFYVSQAANIFDGKTVFIEKDIDLNGAEWTPIGDYAFSRTSFNGIFDGQNHTISNFKVTNPVAWTAYNSHI